MPDRNRLKAGYFKNIILVSKRRFSNIVITMAIENGCINMLHFTGCVSHCIFVVCQPVMQKDPGCDTETKNDQQQTGSKFFYVGIFNTISFCYNVANIMTLRKLPK